MAEGGEKPLFSPDLTLEKIRQIAAKFRDDRDWSQYHSPRNILLALVGEVGELSEIFQWKGEVPVGLPGFTESERTNVEDEMADVLIYLILLADRCNVDLPKAVLNKFRKNEAKYPADKVRGDSRKYNEYE